MQKRKQWFLDILVVILIAMILFVIVIPNLVAEAVEKPTPTINFDISIDGEEVKFNDVMGHPFINQKSRTMVPIRIVSEQMGYKVDWDGATNTAIITDNKDTIRMQIGKTTAVKNGKSIPIDVQDGKTVDTKAMLVRVPGEINSRTYVPLRFISEAFGAEVEYDRTTTKDVVTHHISITTKKVPPVSKNFIEPEIRLSNRDVSSGHFFSIMLDNNKDYVGSDAVFNTRLVSHTHYNHFKLPNIFNGGELVTIDRTDKYANEKPREGLPTIEIFGFDKTGNQIDLNTNKPQSPPKKGEVIKVKMTLTMNGESKDYNLEIPIGDESASF